MNKNKQQYAVLTGDMVGSSQWKPGVLKNVMQHMRNSVPVFEQTFPGSVLGTLDVFSGDGWQLLLNDWTKSLRAALYLRAVCKSYNVDAKQRFDTRIAVAWGMMDESTLNLERISESTGDVFTASGRSLKTMKKHERLALAEGAVSDAKPFLGVAVHLVDELSAHWTPRQAQTLVFALLNYGQEEIAKRLKKKQPTVNRSLHGAGWRGIEGLLETVEYSRKEL